MTTDFSKKEPSGPGRLLAFSTVGTFIADLTPDPALYPREQFHPRQALVVGPDGLLYVTNVTNLPAAPAVAIGGQVLHLQPRAPGRSLMPFLSDPGGVGQLNRPEGVVFGLRRQLVHDQLPGGRDRHRQDPKLSRPRRCQARAHRRRV